MRSFSKGRLGGVTAMAMAIATFPYTIFSVLAGDLISEFEISRAQLGILATATGLVGALTSPYWGRVTDRVGSYTSTFMVLAGGAVTLLGLAASPTYLVMVVASLASGLPNGWCNPATNSLIVDTVAAGSRGVVTGVKQSGVQIGTFLGGALLPLLAVWWGWRGAAAIFVLLPLVGMLGMIGKRPLRHQAIAGEWGHESLPREVIWVALYGAVSGLATSAMFVFLPLFAEEDQGWSPGAAGLLIAIIGLLGVIARIYWPSAAERWIGHGRTLKILAVLSTVSALIVTLVSMGIVAGWALVPAALLLAIGSVAWNAVGMLAVMDFASPRIVGKSTGVVLLGFLLGYAFGSPIMGFSVDTLGSYTPGWLGAAVLLATTSVIAVRIPPGSTLANP